jgi:hypothetical protein
MSYIDLTDPAYVNLSQMAVYAQGALAATSDGSLSISVNNGYWSGMPITESPVSALKGSPGVQSDSTFLGNCVSQFTTLLTNITLLTSSLPFTDAYGVTTFTPGVYKTNVDIIYTSKNITFDGRYNPNAQFFIYADNMFFTNTNFNLINGARAGNIFWISTYTTSSDITITNSTILSDMIVPGIFITYKFTSINSGTYPLVINGLILVEGTTSPGIGGITLTNSGTSTFEINLSEAGFVAPPAPLDLVNLNDTCPHSTQFAVLSKYDLTITGGAVTINDGYWYGAPILTPSPGSLIGVGTLNGFNPDPFVNPDIYTTEQADLLTRIKTVTNAGPTLVFDNTTTVFNANYKYYASLPVTYTEETIVFTAGGDPNAQFFIISDGSFTFERCSFEYYNGAQPKNIFWLSSGGVNITDNLSFPGIIITSTDSGTVSVSYNGSQPFVMNGHIFSSKTILLDNDSSSSFTIQTEPVSTITPTTPTYIDLNVLCPYSTQFAVLTNNNLFTTTTIGKNVTIQDGYWYGMTVETLPNASTLIGTGTLSGFNVDPGLNPTVYTNESSNLIMAIKNAHLVSANFTDITTTFYSGYFYHAPDNEGVSFQNTIITFDAGGDTNGQFFITADYFTFTNVTFILSSSAQANNIFWVSRDDVSITNSSVPGIITTSSLGSVVSVITNDNTNIVMNGHIFSKNNVTLNSSSGGTGTITIVALPISTTIPFVDLNIICPYSTQFAVLSTYNLDISSGVINVNNGYWYGNPINIYPPGSIIGSGTLSGYNSNPSVDPTKYTDEQTALIDIINTVTTGHTIPFDNTTTTFNSNSYYYYNGIDTGVTYTGKTITFDAQNNPRGQFFISADNFSFENCSFVFLNQAKEGNIFWLAQVNINLRFNLSFPGILITIEGDVIVGCNGNQPFEMKGHIFSSGAVGVENAGTSTFTIEADPVSPIIPPTPPTYINLNITCPYLTQFAVISNNDLEISTGAITINDGYWYGSPININSPGSIIGSGTLNGFNPDPYANPDRYSSQKNDLLEQIQTVTSNITHIKITNDSPTYIFYPNYYYYTENGTTLTYSGDKLTFDANGNGENAQFFISSDIFRFENCSFDLLNNAQEKNIFWLAQVNFNLLFNASFPGIVITIEGNVLVGCNGNQPFEMKGHIFSGGAVGLENASSSSFTIQADPVSPIIPNPPTYLDLNETCPKLTQFAVATVTTGNLTTSSITNPIIIKNGYWYGYPVSSTPALSASGLPYGPNNDIIINPGIYNDELNYFTEQLNTLGLAQGEIINTTTTTPVLLYPGYYYIRNGGNGFVFENTTITFDGLLNPNSQFFIYAVSIDFTNVTFLLINDASEGNIFWLTSKSGSLSRDGYININNSSVPGFIKSEAEVTVNSSISTIIKGHIYTTDTISLTSTAGQLTIEADPVSTISPPYQPPFIDINVICPLSVKFALLAIYNALTTTSPDTLPIHIQNGYWYGKPVDSTPELVGDGTVLQGYNNDPDIHFISYENEFDNLYNKINSEIQVYQSVLTSNITTFYPEYLYKSPGGNLDIVTYDGVELIFDANGNTNAQFFINPSNIIFTNVTFSLLNGASKGNIFWLCNSVLTITNSVVPGIIVTNKATIDLNDYIEPPIMFGHIFSYNAITLNTTGTTELTISATPVSENTDDILPSTYINLNAVCHDLIQFAVLAQNGPLSTTVDNSLNVPPITIQDGYWYGNTVTSDPEGSLVGTGTLSGFNNLPATRPIYIEQLNALLNVIFFVTQGYILPIINNTNTTFYPEYLYKNTQISGINYDAVTIDFDAGGNPDAQFFINATSFAFDGTIFTFSGGAQESNIFWVADTSISIVNAIVPGILIAMSPDTGVEVVFRSDIITDIIMNGHIFAINTIILRNFSPTYSLTIQSNPIPEIYIDLDVTCPHLSQFAVFSLLGNLTSESPPALPTIIQDGYWYGDTVVSNPALVGSGDVLSGYNKDPSIHPIVYQLELDALINEITTVTDGSQTIYTNNDRIFYPGIYYSSNGAEINYQSIEITFDAKGDPKAQFFIQAPNFTIEQTTFLLINGTQPGNIFWLSDSYFYITNVPIGETFPGIILATTEVNVFLDKSRAMILNGHIYSLNTINISTPPSGDGSISIQAAPISRMPPFPELPDINLNRSYPNLTQFAVICQTELYTSSPPDNTRPLTINDGYWFGNPINSTHPIISSGQFSGLNNDPASDPTKYRNELDLLRSEIFLITAAYRIPVNSDTFYSQYLYINYETPTTISPPAPLVFGNVELTFDAGNNANSQFFIHAASFTFTETTFNLINGAVPNNITWVSDGLVEITNSSVPGIIISRGDGDQGVVVNYTSVTTPMILRGHIFSKAGISITSEAPKLLNKDTDDNLEEPLRLSGLGPLGVTIFADPVYVPPPLPPKPPVVCYAKGTLILTKHGFIPIENMKAGDKVVTNGKIYKNKIAKQEKPKSEPVVWVGKFKVEKLNSSSRPICITKNSLANNFPFQDLYVSPNHSMIINDEMVLAKDLVNENTIYQDMECEDVEYYHLECENHSTIIANGVLSESYLNMDNRSVFENSLKIHPKKYTKSNMSKILSLK